MSETYKIGAVSEKIKNWSSQHGDFTTYYVRLEGQSDTVQVNKKSSSPSPKVGDEIYGDLTESEYGTKFKSASKPFGGSARTPESNDTQDNIARSVALKASVEYWAIGASANTGTEEEVLDTADKFLTWLTGSQGKVQGVPSSPETAATNDSKPQSARDWDNLGKDEPMPKDFGLKDDDIPDEFK